MIKFQSMELDDEAKSDLAITCAPACSPDKKLIPEFPWGLRITLENAQLGKLGLTAADFEIGATIHLHAMSRVTSISEDQSGDKVCRVELQIEQLATENEDSENEEAEKPKPRARLRAVYGK